MAVPSPAKKPTNGPPEEVPAGELWQLLQSLPRPMRKVPFPRTLPGSDEPIGEIVIWPLTQEEHHQANVAAEIEVRRRMGDEAPKKDDADIAYQNLVANEIAVQQLWRACRDVNDPVKLAAFPAPKVLRMSLTQDEVGVLYNHFLTTQVELGPIITRLEPAEYEAWVRRLAEGGAAFPFDLLSWDQRTTLVRTMASQLVSFWTATSSAGQQPDETSTDLSQPSETDDEPKPSRPVDDGGSNDAPKD